MYKKALFLFLLILMAGVVYSGTAKGTFVLDGKTYKIVSVDAKTDENPFDQTKTDALVLLTDQPAGGTFNLDDLDALAESDKLHGILVRIDDQKQVTHLIVLGVVQRSGNSICSFDAERFEPAHVSGRIYLDAPDESFGRKYTFDIDFDTPLQQRVNPLLDESSGIPLPPDGGEPFKVYREYEKAIQVGDPQLLKKYLVPEQAERLEDPEAGKMLGLMKMMRSQEVRLVKGFQQGERATFTVEGKDPVSGGKTSGTVKMIRLNGQWVLEKESWTSSL